MCSQSELRTGALQGVYRVFPWDEPQHYPGAESVHNPQQGSQRTLDNRHGHVSYTEH